MSDEVGSRWIHVWMDRIYSLFDEAVKTVQTFPRDITAIYRSQCLARKLSTLQSRNVTVGGLFDEVVKKYPDKICFYFEDEAWTFIQVQEYANKVGNYFNGLGYKKGDCIALMMDNRPMFIFCWLGLSRIGVITSWINYNLRHQSLSHSIKAGGSKAVIFDKKYYSFIAEIASKDLTEDLGWFTFGTSIHHESEDFKDRLQPVDLIPVLMESPTLPPHISEPVNFEDILCYIFTSGTTGFPKSSVMTHSRAISMSYGLHYMIGLSKNDILYTPLPLYHVQGGICGVGQALFFGLSQVLVRKFSASGFWTDCIRYNVTVSQYLGEICRYLLSQPPKPEDRLHSVKKMFGNGMRVEIWKPFLERFNHPRLMELYGSSEGNCQMANFEGVIGACGFSHYGLLGLLFPSPLGLYKIKESTGELLRDSSTGLAIPCQPNEEGEVLGLISDHPMRAFQGYTDTDSTSKKIVCNIRQPWDQYFRSCDVIVQDELNYFRFVDRLGSSFRWKGELVSSEQIGSVISTAMGLQDVVVFGVQVPHMEGKAGMAVLENSEIGTKMIAKRLSWSVNELLPNYARPVFVRFVQTLNHTGTYKLMKTALQQEGFDVTRIKDPIYCLQPGKTYVPLDSKLYNDILNGNIRL